ncbi:MAG: hypothetical protein Q7V58_09465 [Actinomycetota bacterium]|nr:hypothetical protein [Actinomycetota bacterium]
MTDSQAIVFPDVEDLLREFYVDQLAGIEGYATVAVHAGERPDPLPAKFLLVTRTGGTSQDLVTDRAQVTVQAYAKSGGSAGRFASLARALIGRAERNGLLGTVPIYEVREFSAPYSDPDELAPEHYRYSATYQVAVRGQVL